MIKMNKKGIFFTFAAIALSIVIIFSFKVYSDFGLKDEMEVIEIRINTMNNFILDLENDLENAIFITGFRSLLSLEDYMTDKDLFFDSTGVLAPKLQDAFEETFRDGTITFGGSTDNMGIMDNNTFLNWTDRIKSQSNRTNIKLEFNIDSVTIRQSGPWTVEVEVQLDIDIEDEKNTASWTITNKEYTARINITSEGSTAEKFVDPLYIVYNDGLANNAILITPVTDFSGAGLVTHLAPLDGTMGSSYYRGHSDAPNYLMRFEGNLGSDPNGIESLVDTPKLAAAGATTYPSKTAVDYIYFDTTNNPSDEPILGMEAYPWFELDYSGGTCDPTTGHVLFYQRACV